MVSTFLGVAVPIRLVAIVATGFVEKEGKRKRDPETHISSFSRTYGAEHGADTEKENQNFFHRGADLRT